MTTIDELRKLAKKADINPEDAGGERTKLTDKETYVLEVVRVWRNDPAKKDRDGFGIMFRVLEGPDNVNRVVRDNFTIVEEYPNLVAKVLYSLGQIAGAEALVDKLFESHDTDTLTETIKGAKVSCLAGYRKGSDFPENRYTTYDDTPTVVVSDDDDGLSWDD